MNYDNSLSDKVQSISISDKAYVMLLDSDQFNKNRIIVKVKIERDVKAKGLLLSRTKAVSYRLLRMVNGRLLNVSPCELLTKRLRELYEGSCMFGSTDVFSIVIIDSKEPSFVTS